MARSPLPDGPLLLGASAAPAMALEEPFARTAAPMFEAPGGPRRVLLTHELFHAECANGSVKAACRERLKSTVAVSVALTAQERAPLITADERLVRTLWGSRHDVQLPVHVAEA